MIEFRTLGEIDLTDASGDGLDALLVQPMRMALLAYLSSERRGFHRRDVLFPLFWPEADRERARHALNQALYVLRRELGRTAVVSRGAEEVGIAPDRLRCDAPLLEAALAEGRRADALELYRGEFLPGFHLSRTPCFDDWLTEKRRSLERRCREAAVSLADEHRERGDPEGAVRWARRAVEVDPYGEAVHHRLLSLLDGLGRPVEALRAYRSYAHRLRAELGLRPPAEIAALAEGLGKEAARGAPRAGAAEAAADPDRRVLVFPFAVYGDGRHAYLREGLVSLLTSRLEAEPDLDTVAPESVLSDPTLREAGRLGLATASRLAGRSGAGRFVLGDVVAADGRIQLRAWGYRADRAREPVARASVVGPDARLFELRDDLVADLLPGLGSSSSRPAAATAG